MVKIKSPSNKWVSGTTPLYCWEDGNKLRLTDKSEIPMGSSIVGVYEDLDHIEQTVVDDITSYNNNDITLTQYKSKNKIKITDKIKIGKLQAIQSRKPKAKDPTKNNGLRGIFGPTKSDPIPHVAIKVLDGRSYWVSSAPRPAYGTYWWDYVVWYWGYFPEFASLYPDVYQLFRYRTINKVAISGHYQTDMVEVIPTLVDRVNPGGGYFTQLNTIGIYDCIGHNSSYPAYADARDHLAYVGLGTYEEVMQGKYEGIFDNVIADGGPNTYNIELGVAWLQHIDFGVKTSETEYCLLLPPTITDEEHSYSNFVEPTDQTQRSRWWWRDVNEFADMYPPATWPPSFFISDDLTDHGFINDYGASNRAFNIAKNVPFSSTHAETLHLSFPGDPGHGLYCDFNLSDKTNFCMSRTKNEYSEHCDIIIPPKSSPTIEVILMPTKWKYILWMFGMFNNGSGFIPKWLCTNWEGTAPRVGVHIWSSVPDDINGWYGFTSTLDKYLYYDPPNSAGDGMVYDRYSGIYTPAGLKYGPVWTSQHIDDVISSSLSLWYRMAADVYGYKPENGYATYSPIAPAYSCWKMPRKAGQLVAIIRVLYDTGVADHRYVYAKIDSTDAPVLQAYAHVQTKTSLGSCAMDYASHWYYNFPGTPILGGVIEDDIPAPFIVLYDAISTAHLGDRRIP